MFKIFNSNNDLVLEAESRKHLTAQALLFFECTEFEIDFINMRASFLGEQCKIEEV